MVEPTMDILSWLRKQLEQASPDLLREMVSSFAEALMGAEADALCGAGYRERSPERVNIRNGYRDRTWDTRVGTIELQIPKLRSGTYFPDWLLTPRRRAEQALVSVVADAYLAGVSTRRVEKLVQQLGIERLSKSQVSRLAKTLDALVEDGGRRRKGGDARRAGVGGGVVRGGRGVSLGGRRWRCRRRVRGRVGGRRLPGSEAGSSGCRRWRR